MEVIKEEEEEGGEEEEGEEGGGTVFIFLLRLHLLRLPFTVMMSELVKSGRQQQQQQQQKKKKKKKKKESIVHDRLRTALSTTVRPLCRQQWWSKLISCRPRLTRKVVLRRAIWRRPVPGLLLLTTTPHRKEIVCSSKGLLRACFAGSGLSPVTG
jgi:hypothetical protein